MALRLSGHVYLSGHGDVRCVVEHPSDCVNDRLPGASRGRPHGQFQQQLLDGGRRVTTLLRVSLSLDWSLSSSWRSSAGVSPAVVSYVINDGPRRVAPATADRVRDAIDVLGYRPNSSARERCARRGSTFDALGGSKGKAAWERLRSTQGSLKITSGPPAVESYATSSLDHHDAEPEEILEDEIVGTRPGQPTTCFSSGQDDQERCVPPVGSVHRPNKQQDHQCQESEPQDARTYNPAPTLWRYDPQTNILWLKLTDASSNTSWFPLHLNQLLQSVDYTGAA